MNVGVLPVGIVSEQELRMFPAVEARHFAKWCLCCRGQAVRLSVTVVRTLDMRGLDLASVVDNSASGINK